MNSYQPSLYWLPQLIFDDPEPPDWLSHASLDLEIGGRAQHSMHIWIDENPGLGSRQLNLYVVFGQVQILGADLSEQTIDEVADEVKAWWHDMRRGRTKGQYGIVPAGPIDSPARKAES